MKQTLKPIEIKTSSRLKENLENILLNVRSIESMSFTLNEMKVLSRLEGELENIKDALNEIGFQMSNDHLREQNEMILDQESTLGSANHGHQVIEEKRVAK